MKIIIYILVFGFFVSGCGEEVITTILDFKNGIAYLPNEKEPFTGKYEKYYLKEDLNDRLMAADYFLETIFEDKKPEDGIIGINKITKWWFIILKHQKFTEINYKDGKKNGLATSWEVNGQKSKEINYKDGKKNGLLVTWHENGHKGSEKNYKDGKENGLQTTWYDNGEILTVNYIDGKLDKSFHAKKSEQKTNEPTKEIISRCQTQMGEHGAAIVKACVDQDIEALQALGPYLENHEAITKRCLNQMIENGYAIVKACADQDIEAEEALRRY